VLAVDLRESLAETVEGSHQLAEGKVDDRMMQLQIVAPGCAEWREVDVPQPREGEVLMRVEAVSTCAHWDMHIMSGAPMFPGRPVAYPYTAGQPGHEAVGTLIALGLGVAEPAVGTRVAAWRDQGHHVPGCYGGYVCLAVENVLAVPDELPPEAIAPLELAMCVQVSFDQLARLGVLEGARFGVSGLGPAGLIAMQMARAYGAREVIGIEPLPERRALAADLGADQVMAPDAGSLPAGRSGEMALDAAIDCTGLKASVEFLMARTRQGVAVFGVLREEVRFGFEHWAGLALLGAGAHNRGAAERALALVKAGKLQLAPTVSHTLALSRYAEGVALLQAQEATKICFLPWPE
jgi:threonine dehydrogenase-like Zn-dependent dehydrogenase